MLLGRSCAPEQLVLGVLVELVPERRAQHLRRQRVDGSAVQRAELPDFFFAHSSHQRVAAAEQVFDGLTALLGGVRGVDVGEDDDLRAVFGGGRAAHQAEGFDVGEVDAAQPCLHDGVDLPGVAVVPRDEPVAQCGDLVWRHHERQRSVVREVVCAESHEPLDDLVFRSQGAADGAQERSVSDVGLGLVDGQQVVATAKRYVAGGSQDDVRCGQETPPRGELARTEKYYILFKLIMQRRISGMIEMHRQEEK